eukprot:9476623-Pyramimonas_sp.AAC.1
MDAIGARRPWLDRSRRPASMPRPGRLGAGAMRPDGPAADGPLPTSRRDLGQGRPTRAPRKPACICF